MDDAELAKDTAQRLRARCVLIVEDEYFIANDLAKDFVKASIEIAGPVPSLGDALALVEQGRIGGAVLDINLNGAMIYPVADALTERGLPFVFVTGYDQSVIPTRFSGVPFCQKPVDAGKVVGALSRAAGE